MNFLKRIFFIILLTSSIYVPTRTDCPGHNYQIGDLEFIWSPAEGSDLWIASNCLDEEKRLIFRQCLGDEWTPNNTDFQEMCRYENAELPSSDCPSNFEPMEVQETNVCIRKSGLKYSFIRDFGVCIQDSIFTIDLNAEEQTKFIAKLTQKFTDDNSFFVMAARWRYPCPEILKNVKYQNVELHDVRCGSFALPLKFNGNVPVNCFEDSCENMCLYLDATTEPYSQKIDTCSEYVIAKPKNTFLHSIGCPNGYFRIEYDYVENDRGSCFSIQMFPDPIAVETVEESDVIQSYCENGIIMNVGNADDLFIFRQLSQQGGLTDENYCLFSLTSNQIVKYSDWDSTYASQIPFFFNWDKTMNYSRIIASGVGSYLAIKPNGQWTWADDSVSCIVCRVQSPIPFPELQLHYNILERKLELEVTHQDFLIKENPTDPGFICFSRYNEVYKANLTLFPVTNGKYIIEDVGVAQYWCSGHSVMYRNYRDTGDPSIFAYGMWFSFEVVTKCSTNCTFNATADLNRFITFFSQGNGYAGIRGSTIVEHNDSETGGDYSFTVLLSLVSWNEVTDNLPNLTDYQLDTAFIFEQLNNWRRESNDMTVTSIKSTEFCLPESLSSVNAIIWGVARMGETILTSPLCRFHENDLPLTRTCSGDSVNGTQWIEAVDVSQCYTTVSQSLLELYADFKDLSHTDNILGYLEELLSQKSQGLLPLDVFLTSRILRKATAIITNIQLIFSIYDTLMLVDDDFLKISSSANSIDVLLDAFDNILLGHIKWSIIGSSEFQKYGNSFINSTLIETFVLDPIVSGVSGIAVYKSVNLSQLNTTTYSVRYIYPNETIFDLATDANSDIDLVVGAYLSTDTLTSFKDISIVISVFSKDTFFQSANVSRESEFYQTNGKIISVKILRPDNILSLPTEIPIFFQSNRTNTSACGVLPFAPINSWDTRPSTECNLQQILIENFQWFALCECNHFTYLTRFSNSDTDNSSNSDTDKPSEGHKQSKTLITFSVITSSFSFFGTFAIFLTAAVSHEWRNRLRSKILIHFSAAITLEMVFMIVIKFNVAGTGCVFMGSTLHYSILVMFCWTLIFMWFQLKWHHFIPNVSHLLPKSTIFGWVLPLLPVIMVLVIDHSSYIPANKDELQLCYPTGWALYLGVVVPVILIFLFNSTVFISVLVSLYRVSRSSVSITNDIKIKLTLPQIFLRVSVFLTLGLTCIFGFTSEVLPSSYTLFSSLFCITATIQAVVLVLYFIVFDVSVRSILNDLITIDVRDEN